MPELHRASVSADVFAEDQCSDTELWQVADEFRAWVIADLQALPLADRESFRGDYLFIIDGQPAFLVMVNAQTVASARLSAQSLAVLTELSSDMGTLCVLNQDDVRSVLDGQVRVRVSTDSHTLRRLLRGRLKAKVAYLNGLVKIQGDLPCFMRLVSVLKRRGVGPVVNP